MMPFEFANKSVYSLDLRVEGRLAVAIPLFITANSLPCIDLHPITCKSDALTVVCFVVNIEVGGGGFDGLVSKW